jgi:predicted nucleic acid-binding protein
VHEPAGLPRVHGVPDQSPHRRPVHTTAEALAALEDWLAATTLLFDDLGVQKHWERLIEKYAVRGKQVHDAYLVATMLGNSVGCLATRNAPDFERYVPEGIRVIGPTTH